MNFYSIFVFSSVLCDVIVIVVLVVVFSNRFLGLFVCCCFWCVERSKSQEKESERERSNRMRSLSTIAVCSWFKTRDVFGCARCVCMCVFVFVSWVSYSDWLWWLVRVCLCGDDSSQGAFLGQVYQWVHVTCNGEVFFLLPSNTPWPKKKGGGWFFWKVS